MTRVMARLSSMDAKSYTTISAVVLGLLCLSLLQIMPHTYIQYWKMGLSGAVWMISGFVVLSGRHVPLSRSAPFAMMWSGLTMTIPTLRIEDPTAAPVYLLGSALFLMGVAFLSAQTAYDLYRRWKMVEGK